MKKSTTTNPSLIIVIPCYNESKKLRVSDYKNFIVNNKEVLICFVNDGSTDGTLEILNALKGQFNENVTVIDLVQNVGKAEAVRQGMISCNASHNTERIAFLDADLATSLEECKLLSQHISKDICFVFGRIIATFISNLLSLKVYDTQCGCKIFSKEISEILFKEPFISKWLFDVELFQRMMLYFGRQKAIEKMLEVPLKRWVDVGDSKVKITYFFKLWFDLYYIHRVFKRKMKKVPSNPLNE